MASVFSGWKDDYEKNIEKDGGVHQKVQHGNNMLRKLGYKGGKSFHDIPFLLENVLQSLAFFALEWTTGRHSAI